MATYEIKLKLENTFIDYTSYATGIDFTREQLLGFDGKHQMSSLTMTLKYEPTLFARLVNSNDPIEVKVRKNNADYFTGIIRTNGNYDITHKLEFLEVEVLDNSYKLEVEVGEEIVHVASTGNEIVVCNNNTPLNSLVHILLHKAGLTAVDYSITVLENTPLDFYRFEKDELVSDILDTLFFEYGYSYYFNPSGKFVLQRIAFANDVATLTTFNNTNVIQPLNISKQEQKYDGVVVEAERIKRLNNQLVYRALSNPSDTILIPYGLYYPPEAEVVQNLQHVGGEDKKFLYSLNHTLSASYDNEVEVVEQSYTSNTASIRFHNTDLINDKRIYKFDVRADLLKSEKIEYPSAGEGKNKEKYTARFFSYFEDPYRVEGNVENLVDMMVSRQKTNNYEFSFFSKDSVPLGVLATLQDLTTGISTKVMIVGKTETDGEPAIHYSAVAVNTVNVGLGDIVIGSSSSGLIPDNITGIIEDINTDLGVLETTVGGHTTSLNTQNNRLNSLQNQLNALDGVGEGWEDFSQMVSDSATAIEGLLTDVSNIGLTASTALANANSALTGVGANAGNITSLSSTVSGLGTSINTEKNRIENLLGRMETAEDDLTSVTERVTTAEGTIVNQGTSISQNAGNITSLAGRVTSAEGKITTQGTSISQNAGSIASLATRVTTAEGTISSQGTSITQNANAIISIAGDIMDMNGEITDLETSITQNAGSISSLATRVSTAEGTISNHTTSINQNANSISSVAGRVTTAEGKITSQGSLISQNANSISSVAGRVTTAEGKITSQGSLISQNANSITSIVSDISSINGDITDIEGDITALETSITQNAGSISSLATRVSTAEGTISNHTTSINQNANAITALAGRVSTNEGAITTHGTSITQNANAITAVATRVTTAEGKIATQGTSISQNADNITSLVGRVSTTEEDISTALSSISQNADNIAMKVEAVNSQGNILQNARIEVALKDEEGFITLDADKILLSGSVKADKIDVDSLMTEELEVKNVLYSGYSKNGIAPQEGSGFWLSSTGKLKASNAELIGSIRSGYDAPESSRISARDKAGIAEGPTFYGTGKNDLDIAVEGGQDGGIWDVIVTRADIENTSFAINEGWWREAKPTSEYQYFRPNSVASRGNVIIVSGNYASWTRSTDGGRTWTPTQKLMYGGYAENYGSQLRWDKVANNGGDTWIMMGSTSWENDSAAGTYITRSLDNGVTWSAPVKMAVHGAQGSCIAGKGNIWIIGGVDGYYYRSTDNGVSWSRDRRSTFRWTDVAYSGDTWLMVSESYLTGTPYKSTNNGSSWYHIGGSTLSSQDIGCLSVNGRGSVWIITASNGNIYRSTDDGETFSQTISGEHMFGRSAWIRYTAFYGSTWIVGDSYKVGYSTDNGSSWQLLPNQIPGTGRIWGLTSSNDEFLALYEYSVYRLQQSTDYIAIRKNSGNLGSEISLYPKRNITIATDTVIKFNDIIGHHAGDRWSFTKDDIASLKLADVNGNVYLTATNGILTVNNMKMNGGSVVGNVNVEGTPYRVWGAVAN